MSLFLRFLACALIVAATSVLAAFAWDQSEAATPESPTQADLRVDNNSPLPTAR